MILLVNLCGEIRSLHRSEFVLPVRTVVEEAGHRVEEIHMSQLNDRLRGTNKETPSSIILCGTGLKDNTYREFSPAFKCLRKFDGNILGICAGMHIIGMLWGGEIIPEKRIGVYPYNTVDHDDLFSEERLKKGYHLHNSTVSLPKNFHVMAGNHGKMDAFKHDRRNIYGFLFHPEVLNHSIIEYVVQ